MVIWHICGVASSNLPLIIIFLTKFQYFFSDYGDKNFDDKKNVFINNDDNYCKYVKIRIV